jgi:hypothetical protein
VRGTVTRRPGLSFQRRKSVREVNWPALWDTRVMAGNDSLHPARLELF